MSATEWTGTQFFAVVDGRACIVTQTSRGEWGWEVWAESTPRGECLAFGYVATREEAKKEAVTKAVESRR